MIRKLINLTLYIVAGIVIQVGSFACLYWAIIKL